MGPSICLLMAMVLAAGPVQMWALEQKDTAAPMGLAVKAAKNSSRSSPGEGSGAGPSSRAVHAKVDPAPTCSGSDCYQIDISRYGDGWRVSRGMDGYGINEEATITFQQPAVVQGQIETERDYDFLFLLGMTYSGEEGGGHTSFNAIADGVGTEEMTWQSDGSRSGAGWIVDFLPEGYCSNPADMPTCSGSSCDSISITCMGDGFNVSRGLEGYTRDEFAEITFQAPARVVAYMVTEDRHDSLSWSSGNRFCSGTRTLCTTEFFFPGSTVLTWSSDGSVQGDGWYLALSPAGGGSSIPWTMLVLYALSSICGCGCCVVLICVCCCAAGSKSASQGTNRPATQLAQQPYQQPMQANQEPLQLYQQPMQPYMQPYQAGGNPDVGGGLQMGFVPGVPDASAPPSYQFQPMPGFQQLQPGFQVQPQPAQMPAFQFQAQPGAGQPGAL